MAATEKEVVTERFYQYPVSRSLGIHLLLLLFAFFYVTQLSKPFAPTAPIEVSFIDKKEAEVEKPKLPLVDDIHKTVVQKSAGEIADVAKKDSYLSDKTRVVKEEQSARNAGEFVAPGSMQPKVQPFEKAVPKPVNLSDLGVKIAPKKAEKYTEQHKWANTQTGEALQGGQYMQGMKEGESSALNTKEFVFFSYFDRVRKQLDQAWQPIIRENIAHIFKVGRKIASNTDYVTKTLVTLNAKGEIVKVQVLEDSGTHELDQAAVDALNKAGPYPNPPKGLMDQQGLVSIRWDFVLKT
jgi:TonB family protein